MTLNSNVNNNNQTRSVKLTTSFYFLIDLFQMYNSQFLDPERNIRTLQAKVMFDIRFYFARRGGENIERMTKNTFELKSHPETGIKYIEKVIDEETKNHKEVDGQIVTGYMPEMPNQHKLCSVQSFLTYIYSLTKDSNELWQTSQFTEFPEDPRVCVFYRPNNVGHNTHEHFIGRLAKKLRFEGVWLY